ncbi:MAG: enoyl-CoA hydratase/isomerase family protein [candidate division WOR-3 bacterium]|nr:MAG: enoyl-CoA hydratase/isomerase family protein [candidate division WOR-3 bacterium]
MQEKEFKTIRYEVKENVAVVTFNRPEVHNAFDDVMIGELAETFDRLAAQTEVRAVVLTGEGKSFCAGADLNWMRRVKDYSYDDNLKESLELSDMLYKAYSCPKPTIARVNGAAIGGGTGLVAVCDIAVAARSAKFSFSEVKLGLIPACISPYVVKKCGEGKCREFFLTGERLSAEKALTAGLVNAVTELETLDALVDQYLTQLISSGPSAITTCKELLRKVPQMSYDEVKRYTAEVIAQIRVSEEGQEGMAAFLEKRKPRWDSDSG